MHDRVRQREREIFLNDPPHLWWRFDATASSDCSAIAAPRGRRQLRRWTSRRGLGTSAFRNSDFADAFQEEPTEEKEGWAVIIMEIAATGSWQRWSCRSTACRSSRSRVIEVLLRGFQPQCRRWDQAAFRWLLIYILLAAGNRTLVGAPSLRQIESLSTIPIQDSTMRFKSLLIAVKVR